MAARLSLREYQRELSERLSGAEERARTPSKLGLQVGEQSCLVELTEAGELIPVPPITPVPLTREWFKGVVNVRGNLYSVVDLCAFLGGAPATLGEAARLLLLADRFQLRSALLVDRALGLRETGELTPVETPRGAPWIRAQHRDGKGRLWKELDIHELVQHAAFLDVAA